MNFSHASNYTVSNFISFQMLGVNESTVPRLCITQQLQPWAFQEESLAMMARPGCGKQKQDPRHARV